MGKGGEQLLSPSSLKVSSSHNDLYEQHDLSSRKYYVKASQDRFLPVAALLIAMQGIYVGMKATYGSGAISASPEFCQNSADETGKCGRGDLFAFQVVSGLVFLFCSSVSLYYWYYQGHHQALLYASPSFRLFGCNQCAKSIMQVNLAYQIWDFAISLTIPEHCTLIMMTHHVVAAIVGWSALYSGMLSTYVIFYAGISEVSSIFLVLVDAGRYFDLPLASGRISMLPDLAAPLFVLSFAYYRVIRWIPISFQMYRDVHAVVRQGHTRGSQKLRSGQARILYLWLSLVIPMSGLQLYWMFLIMAKVKAMVTEG